MNPFNTFSYGVIMGYYGPIWSDTALSAYSDFCKQYGHSYFIYAPKEETLLRQEWAKPFTESQLQALKQIRDYFEDKGIKFGIGLSPYGLNKLNDQGRAELKAKIEQINCINPTIFGVFFDDIDKSAICAELGKEQVAIAAYAASISSAASFITVPTYYTHDQILQRVLGPTPPNYFADFSSLDEQFSIFWSGTHIISMGYTQGELDRMAEIFKRKVMVWDNYPVNDPPYLADYLRIFALTARPQELTSSMAGIAFNPMVQPYLSMIPLATAKDSFLPHYNPRQAYLEALDTLCGKKLAHMIDQYLNYFLLNGIRRTEMSNIDRMVELFSSCTDEREQKFTRELIDLLNFYKNKG